MKCPYLKISYIVKYNQAHCGHANAKTCGKIINNTEHTTITEEFGDCCETECNFWNDYEEQCTRNEELK